MELQGKLVKLRKERGWSQAELSERVGVHIAHLSRLENGKSQPSSDLLWKLARAYGVTMDYLIDDKSDQPGPVSIKDKGLAERIEMIDELEEEDRQTVVNVIDSMLTKKKMLDLLTRTVPRG